jgi:hypothetical protein
MSAAPRASRGLELAADIELVADVELAAALAAEQLVAPATMP